MNSRESVVKYTQDRPQAIHRLGNLIFGERYYGAFHKANASPIRRTNHKIGDEAVAQTSNSNIIEKILFDVEATKNVSERGIKWS